MAGNVNKGKEINLMTIKNRMSLVLLLRDKKDHFTNRTAADIAAEAAKELGFAVTKWNIKNLAEVVGLKLRRMRRPSGDVVSSNAKLKAISEELAAILVRIDDREKKAAVMAHQIFTMTAALDTLEAKLNNIGRELGFTFVK